MSITERLKARAGVVAFLVSAVTFGALSMAHSRPGVASTAPVMVPLMTHFVAAGQAISRRDWRWVRESQLKAVKEEQLVGVARVPLEPGQVLSPTVLGGVRRPRVMVVVAPTDGADVRIARIGSSIDVLVRSAGSTTWQSGPIPVVAVSAQVGTNPSVNVLMSLNQAMQYEALSRRGTVEILGMVP